MGLLARWRGTLPNLLAGLAALLIAADAGATAVRQAPWQPEATAYRATLFLAELAPVPWPAFETVWFEPYPGAASATPAFDLLTGRPEGQASVTAIREAVSREDRQALFEATTRAAPARAAFSVPAAWRPSASLAPLPENVVAGKSEPAMASMLPPGSSILDQDPLLRLVLNCEEQGTPKSDLPMVAYGDMLFDSPETFGSPARDIGLACSTCHNRSDTHRDLFVLTISNRSGAVDVGGSSFNALFCDRNDNPIEILSLRGMRFTGPYARAGGFVGLRDFTPNLILDEFEGAEPAQPGREGRDPSACRYATRSHFQE